MRKKLLLAVALNLLAVAAPAFSLVIAFGSESVDPQSARHLLWLVGCGVFAFTVGSIAARMLKEGEPSPFDIFEITIREERAAPSEVKK